MRSIQSEALTENQMERRLPSFSYPPGEDQRAERRNKAGKGRGVRLWALYNSAFAMVFGFGALILVSTAAQKPATGRSKRRPLWA